MRIVSLVKQSWEAWKNYIPKNYNYLDRQNSGRSVLRSRKLRAIGG